MDRKKMELAILVAIWDVEKTNRITKDRNYLRPMLTSFDVARIAVDNLKKLPTSP